MTREILVIGGTGRQGGAAIRRLLADGWTVRALVRDPATPAAVVLAAAGADLVVGDLADRDSLDAAVAGAYGVFSAQPAGPHEVAQGTNVAMAARDADVRHVVYASVGGADRDSGISHWETKWEIERRIRALGLPHTILRPVMFMENHADPHSGVFGDFSLVRMMAPGARVQLIAVADIGAFAGLAFARPDVYLGRAIEIAGDEVTREELVTAVAAATGRAVPVEPLPRDVILGLELDPDEYARTGSFGGWRADIPTLRGLNPALTDFPTWIARTGAALLGNVAASTGS